jgi:hypothetical protein
LQPVPMTISNPSSKLLYVLFLQIFRRSKAPEGLRHVPDYSQGIRRLNSSKWVVVQRKRGSKLWQWGFPGKLTNFLFVIENFTTYTLFVVDSSWNETCFEW